MRTRKQIKRWRDQLLYLVIGVLVVLLVVLYAVLAPDSEFPLVPVSVIVFTLLIFGYVVSIYRAKWKTIRFWFVLMLIFTFHCAIAVFAVLSSKHISLLLVTVLAWLELRLIILIIERLERPRTSSPSPLPD